MAVATAEANPKHNLQLARQAYYDKISGYNLAPLWEVLKNLVTPEPKTQIVPHIWKFPDVEKLMLEAGDVITAEEAERRVLVLENPGDPGKARITNTLFAGIQLIMPGEIADVHRHVASAIRFVLKGNGAYTAVEGEKAEMAHGDFIITANWAPHDHGNPGKEPVMWLDVLDMPTINHFQTSFAEHFTEKMQNVNHEDGDSFERYASGVLPDGAPAHMNRSPVINYPYAKMRPILERLKKTGDVDKRFGARVRYANPINGGPVLPTMGANLSLFPSGFKGEDYRSTDAAVFAVAEGKGKTIVDGKAIEWGVNDVFVVPPWKRYHHEVAGEDAVLFSISDRPAQEALGIWREGK
ncbi:gentisate 1,2-dioxygenase [Pseudolabrys taiwanensis]|uniref:Gentisate 1,2-dioxygenase n=1 Tax=Pseudolabrys taiwanensis TaxID=331696 RepID=A0A345ZVX5_9HYPH|nr:gentisate 1,2-dioxygenase [Pseudolabrys taiwanensis]AXK81072.1 gentisate 1,2-dioxygenase [Pseudolabrys taiwanensis]